MRKTIALDANLLVLLVVGLTKLKDIEAHKRLKAYGVDDFRLLEELISNALVVCVRLFARLFPHRHPLEERGSRATNTNVLGALLWIPAPQGNDG